MPKQYPKPLPPDAIRRSRKDNDSSLEAAKRHHACLLRRLQDRCRHNWAAYGDCDRDRIDFYECKDCGLRVNEPDPLPSQGLH